MRYKLTFWVKGSRTGHEFWSEGIIGAQILMGLLAINQQVSGELYDCEKHEVISRF